MLSFLLAVHFVLTIAIIGLILLQKHDSDGALGSSGGGAASGMFSVRGQANLLTRSTAILMTIFVLNCLLMAKIAKHTPAQGSVIDRAAQEQMPVKSPTVPAKAPEAAPAAPATPAESTAPGAPAQPAKPVPQPAKKAPKAPAKK